MVSAGEISCCMPARCCIRWMWFAVFHTAMNGGTMISQPKISAIRERTGLIVSSRSNRRISSLTL
jgi:hypothetical protein